MTKIDFKGADIKIENSKSIDIGNIKEHDKLGDKIVSEVAKTPIFLKYLVVVALIVAGIAYLVVKN